MGSGRQKSLSSHFSFLSPTYAFTAVESVPPPPSLPSLTINITYTSECENWGEKKRGKTAELGRAARNK